MLIIYTDYYVLIDWLIDNTAEEAIRSIIKLLVTGFNIKNKKTTKEPTCVQL